MLYYNSKWCGAVVCSAKYMQQECSYVGEAGAEAGGRAMLRLKSHLEGFWRED
jgi:hypothetical protein